MIALDFSMNQKYSNKNIMIKMAGWIRNLCNAVSAPIAVTWDALAKRLQSVRESASLLYNRVMQDIKYGQERLKII